MKNILSFLQICWPFIFLIIFSFSQPTKDCNCNKKDEIISGLMKLHGRLTNEQLGIREVRKHWAFVVYNLDNIGQDTSLLRRIKAEIMKTDSALKNVNERMDFTAEELNSFYKKHELTSSKE